MFETMSNEDLLKGLTTYNDLFERRTKQPKEEKDHAVDVQLMNALFLLKEAVRRGLLTPPKKEKT